VTASALSFPSRMSGMRIDTSGNAICTCSLKMAGHHLGAALVGHVHDVDAGFST
jgi:hypothetical protein